VLRKSVVKVRFAVLDSLTTSEHLLAAKYRNTAADLSTKAHICCLRDGGTENVTVI